MYPSSLSKIITALPSGSHAREGRLFCLLLTKRCPPLTSNNLIPALLSALFRSTDLVPSDVVAGCVLLRVRQKRETREMRRIQMINEEEPIYTTDVRKIFSETPPWMNLEDAFHYLRLSIAAYGWPYVLYRHCFTGFCKLARHLTCCCCR